MPEKPQYSLWLMPRKELYRDLALRIEELARDYGSDSFEPHVTLLGDVPGEKEEVIRKAGALCKGRKPFEITLTYVDYTGQASKALFIKAEKPAPLESLHRDARKAYSMPSKSGYAPHLSLLYGNHPTGEKEDAIRRMGKEFGKEFTADAIFVVHCSSNVPVKDWHVVQEIKFGRKR
jgi:2'-5' RNA ligase